MIQSVRTNTEETLDGRAASTPTEMARLVGVVAALREHCPWTAALSHDSLTTYLLEESYEFIEAVESGHTSEMANELGDILLQVVLHSRLAQEEGRFELADVIRGLSEKMIRRSPHVFHADGTLQESFPATITEIEATWERVKAAERAGGKSPQQFPARPLTPARPLAPARPLTQSPFAGIPQSLPALAMAAKTLERAQRAGLTQPEVANSLTSHIDSLASHIETEDELGKVLFGVVQVAQQRGLDAERALRLAVRDFQARM